MSKIEEAVVDGLVRIGEDGSIIRRSGMIALENS
jgi:hypothetical protein